MAELTKFETAQLNAKQADLAVKIETLAALNRIADFLEKKAPAADYSAEALLKVRENIKKQNSKK